MKEADSYNSHRILFLALQWDGGVDSEVDSEVDNNTYQYYYMTSLTDRKLIVVDMTVATVDYFQKTYRIADRYRQNLNVDGGVVVDETDVD